MSESSNAIRDHSLYISLPGILVQFRYSLPGIILYPEFFLSSQDSCIEGPNMKANKHT